MHTVHYSSENHRSQLNANSEPFHPRFTAITASALSEEGISEHFRESDQVDSTHNDKQMQLAANESAFQAEVWVDLWASYSHLGEMMFYLQNGGKDELGGAPAPPPPPPPPPIVWTDAHSQTELLTGDIDGLGERLLVYRNRIKLLEGKLEKERKRRGILEGEMEHVNNIHKQTLAKKDSELDEADVTIAQVRKDNYLLREMCQLQEMKLRDQERLVNYYIDEVANLEERIGNK